MKTYPSFPLRFLTDVWLDILHVLWYIQSDRLGTYNRLWKINWVATNLFRSKIWLFLYFNLFYSKKAEENGKLNWNFKINDWAITSKHKNGYLLKWCKVYKQTMWTLCVFWPHPQVWTSITTEVKVYIPNNIFF